jgi:hypothetical protein
MTFWGKIYEKGNLLLNFSFQIYTQKKREGKFCENSEFHLKDKMKKFFNSSVFGIVDDEIS